MAVLRVGVLAPALIQAAIEQDALPAAFHQVHRPGDRARRAPEREFHVTPMVTTIPRN